MRQSIDFRTILAVKTNALAMARRSGTCDLPVIKKTDTVKMRVQCPGPLTTESLPLRDSGHVPQNWASLSMDIRQSAREYENWMRTCAPLVEAHLRDKHTQMKEDPFQFFRGSYYRWAQLWPKLCPDLLNGPVVLSIGDLHVDSFGTWRDFEGRLCWGVDDFDEAWPLPYTNDLVRLAASVKSQENRVCLTYDHTGRAKLFSKLMNRR